MYRLILHGGSYREEQIKALDDMNFFSVVSSNEKQKKLEIFLVLFIE